MIKEIYFYNFSNYKSLESAFMDNKIEDAIKKHLMIPKSLYERPMTSAHEIGWFSKPLVY